MTLQIINENIVDYNHQLKKWFVIFDEGRQWFETELEAVAAASDEKAIDFDKLYAFLKTHYKYERFEGRNGPVWGDDYSIVVTKSYLSDLDKRGETLISTYESKTSEIIKLERRMFC